MSRYLLNYQILSVLLFDNKSVSRAFQVSEFKTQKIDTRNHLNLFDN